MNANLAEFCELEGLSTALNDTVVIAIEKNNLMPYVFPFK